MAAPPFDFNAVVICYNCRRRAISLIEPYESIANHGQSVLNLEFISCGECVKFPHVFNPRKSLLRGYVDVEPYSGIIKDLGIMFRCTPQVLKERSFFSIARQRIKTVARIQDSCQLQVPTNYAIITDKEGCTFFSGEPAFTTRKVTPTVKIDARPAPSSSMPSPSAEPPPPYDPPRRVSKYLQFKQLPNVPQLDQGIFKVGLGPNSFL
jgi:hypothetical protein